MTNLPKIFHEYGCVNVESFIDQSTVCIVSDYFENRIKRGEWTEGYEGPNPSSKYFYYADPLIEVLLTNLRPVVEQITGKELIPTYSYSRIYQPGESLVPHVDRPACEVSVTVNVAKRGNPSCIWMQYKNYDPQKYELKPGDAVVYKGCEAFHWRTPLEGDQVNVQFMLHYVDKNGPNVEHAIDKRPSYGTPDNVRN